MPKAKLKPALYHIVWNVPIHRLSLMFTIYKHKNLTHLPIIFFIYLLIVLMNAWKSIQVDKFNHRVQMVLGKTQPSELKVKGANHGQQTLLCKLQKLFVTIIIIMTSHCKVCRKKVINFSLHFVGSIHISPRSIDSTYPHLASLQYNLLFNHL